MSRPWEARAIELEPIEGDYADYRAWTEWFKSEVQAVDKNSEDFDCILDSFEMITLYTIFCRVFDAADVPVVVKGGG